MSFDERSFQEKRRPGGGVLELDRGDGRDGRAHEVRAVATSAEAALEDGDVAARAAREARERRGRERVEPGARTRVLRRPTISLPGSAPSRLLTVGATFK